MTSRRVTTALAITILTAGSLLAAGVLPQAAQAATGQTYYCATAAQANNPVVADLLNAADISVPENTIVGIDCTTQPNGPEDVDMCATSQTITTLVPAALVDLTFGACTS